MSKQRRQKNREDVLAEIGNNISPLPDRTLDIYSHLEKTSPGSYSDLTTDLDPDTKGSLSQSSSELLEKALSGELRLHPFYVNLFLFLVFVIVVGFVFIQDNGAGKLNDIKGLEWWGIKSLIILFSMILVALIFNFLLKRQKKL